jgi:metallo-beta-lactamase family protein
MHVNLSFLGASQTVTGSKYLLEVDHERILIDCGLFQGLKALRERNWAEFPVPPDSISALVLTHAHIDHIGYLPKLVKEGFNAPIYCSRATADLIPLMLRDAAKLQEEDADYARRKGYSKHADPQPLYTLADAEATLDLLHPIRLGDDFEPVPGVKAWYNHAGHILGACWLTMKIMVNGQAKRIVFSGDLGRSIDPLLDPPDPVHAADVLLVESTYGNRDMIDADPSPALAKIIRETFAARGCVIIPAFAIGRTQSVLYYLNKLISRGSIPSCPVYVDSPMAISATQLYAKHGRREEEGFDGPSPFDFPNLHFTRSQDESKRINSIDEGAIIISASGMVTGGRILHHLFHRLPRPNDTVLFVGYQGQGTRGRRLLEGESTLRLLGHEVPVRARIERIEGLSAHADQAELIEWLQRIDSSPKRTFITHGEPDSSAALASLIRERLEWENVIVPEYLSEHALFEA